jgi:hypothetical protein
MVRAMTWASALHATWVNDMLRKLPGCLFALTLFTTAVYGAEPDAAPAAPEETATDAESAPPEDIDAALAEEIRAAEEAAANAAPADPNESFVPTVQISEDLSVSFPVDI